MRTLLASLLFLTTVAAAAVVDEPREVAIEILTGIEYRRGGELPTEVTELQGQLVSIEGYIALGTLEGSQIFEFVPEECECGRSKIQHFIEVSIRDGGVTYEPGRVTLVGTLDIGEKYEDGFVVSLYRLEIETYPCR